MSTTRSPHLTSTAPTTAPGPRPRRDRRPLAAVVVVTGVSLAGSVLSVVTGLSPTWWDAVGPTARLSVPLPMNVALLVLGVLAAGTRRRVALVASTLLALALHGSPWCPACSTAGMPRSWPRRARHPGGARARPRRRRRPRRSAGPAAARASRRRRLTPAPARREQTELSPPFYRCRILYIRRKELLMGPITGLATIATTLRRPRGRQRGRRARPHRRVRRAGRQGHPHRPDAAVGSASPATTCTPSPRTDPGGPARRGVTTRRGAWSRPRGS